MAQARAVAGIEYWQSDKVARQPIYYPESDGEPMAETDVHRKQMIYLIEALEDRYRDDPQVYVAGNLFIYYVEGDPFQFIAPDVFVVFGVPKRDRRVYKLWEEGRAPDIVIELTSLTTVQQDRGPKKGTYEMLGVREYFIFDPLGEYLDPPLVRYRLEDEVYWPKAGERLDSAILDLELRVEQGLLRLYDPKTGEKLLTPLEAQEKARQEAERRRQAEAEVERLRAEMARLRK